MEAIMKSYTGEERQKHLEDWKKGGLSQAALYSLKCQTL
jgi:hypothetical protein